MDRTELESKHLADLHSLAAEAGIPRYRMLPRGELIAKLAEDGGGGAAAEPAVAAAARPKRRRRRRWGRRRKPVRVRDLLLPAAPGRQAVVYAETREGCTALLREIAAELSDAKGPDPIALLVDPSPEELAEWRREAPGAEIVAAGQARHADDAIAQAGTRAGGGEDVIVLVDSLSRFAEAFGGAEEARQLFDAGRGAAGSDGGSLTVVAALAKP